MISRRTAINKLEKDINEIIAGIYGVTLCVTRNARAIAIELVKRGYIKQEDIANGTQQHKS